MSLPKKIEIGFVRHADGTNWITWEDGESYTIPKTWDLDGMSPELAGLRAVEAGWLAPGGTVKVVDCGWGKGPR